MSKKQKHTSQTALSGLLSPGSLDALVQWFQAGRRSMPWRECRSPYRVWVSEIMLQQTQVATVIPYFNRFMDSFPDPCTLAKAEPGAVLKHWEGLGYYSRARNLHKGARYVLEHHGGHLPANYAELIKVPGIGDYTAGAILSLAFNQPVPAVDGNVVRVLARLTASPWVQGEVKDRRKARELVAAIMAEDIFSDRLTPALLNESLIELGALLCRPKNPLCEACPLRLTCRGFKSGTAGTLPLPKKKKTRPVEQFTVLVLNLDPVCPQRGQFLLYRRNEDGLLGGLWDFPSAEGHRSEAEVRGLLEDRGYAVRRLVSLAGRRHLFSHLEWDMKGFYAEVKQVDPSPAEQTLSYDGADLPPEQIGLFSREALEHLPQATAMDHFRRQLQALF